MAVSTFTVPQKAGLFRASLVLEYDDGTVHTLRVENPVAAYAQVNQAFPEPDIFLDDPAYLPVLAGAVELVVHIKAGAQYPVTYRHD